MNNTAKHVRLYDFDTGEITTIPAAELAPGFIQVQIQGIEGTCWTKPGNFERGKLRHPPFDEERREKIRLIMNSLEEVRPLTFQQWEDGFRMDLHPDKQISLWLHLCLKLAKVCGEHILTTTQRKAVYNVLVTCTSASYEHIWQVVSFRGLPKEIVRDAIEEFFGHPALKQKFAKLKPEDFADESGRVPIPITEFFEAAEARAILRSTDLIFGFDSFSRTQAIFYGADRLKKIVSTGKSEELTTVSVLYDSRTDHLEYLYAQVTDLKGSCCFDQQ